MAVKTKGTIAKEKRDYTIRGQYNELMSDEGAQKFAVYEVIARTHKISTSSVCRIVGNLKTKKS